MNFFGSSTNGKGGTPASHRPPPPGLGPPKVAAQQSERPADYVDGPKVAPAKLAWSKLCYTVGTKEVIKDCSGVVKPGEFTALMGPSGAGKTSLLDLVAGRIDRFRSGRTVTGDVFLNDEKLTSGGFGRMAVYVQQEDSLVGVLTVHETLVNAARLAGVPIANVEPLIDRLGLRSAADVIVGNIFLKGISGGQKRRLSLAEQLITEPSLLLLDEPTSGLDSASALNVCEVLRKLAHQDGCTVLATIHQPASEVFEKFDKVSFMADGQVVYYGGAGDHVITYFEHAGFPCPVHANPADYIIGLINRDFPNHADVDLLVKRWSMHNMSDRQLQRTKTELLELEGMAGSAMEAHVEPRGRASWPVRFATLLWRDLRELIRDPGIIVVRLVMYTMLSVLIGAMFWDLGAQDEDEDISARVGILFYVAAFMVFMSVAVLPFFVMQRDVFTKERANGAYGVVEYWLSKWIVSMPGIALLTLTSAGFVIGMSGLNGFWVYSLDLFLSLMFAEAFMSMMAALVPHYIIGIALAAGCFGFFMLCEGFFKVRDDIPPWLIWGHYMAPHTYTFRIFMVNEFEPIEDFNSSRFGNGTEVLDYYDMYNYDIWEDMGVLAAYCGGFQILFFAVLYFCHTGKR